MIVFKLEIFKFKVPEGLVCNDEGGALFWRAGQLSLEAFHMVQVDVRVAEGMNKVAGCKAAFFGHHHQKHRVTGDVERHPQRDVGAALVELHIDFLISRHIELKEGMAEGGSGPFGVNQFLNVGHVPAAHNVPAGIRILFDLVQNVPDLVDLLAVMTGPADPLLAVNRSQIAPLLGKLVVGFDFLNKFRQRLTFKFFRSFVAFIGPFVPDMHVSVDQIFDVGVTL